MKDKIISVILKVAEEQNSSLSTPIAIDQGENAHLYGPNGSLDSLALVRFIVDAETALQEQLNISVTLASERAMSQKRSPFLTIGSLVAYIEGLLPTQKKA